MSGLEKNYMKRGQTERRTLRLYERISLRADSLKMLKWTNSPQKTFNLYIFLKQKLRSIQIDFTQETKILHNQCLHMFAH